MSSNRLSIGEAIQGFLAEMLNSEFRGRHSTWWVWRVTLLAPRIGNNGSYMSADHSWDSFCLAGTVFGEVGRWLLLLRALEMMFHMWRGSRMRFILRGRRSMWWSWNVTFVAGAAFGDILGDSRSATCCIFQYKNVSKIGRARSPKRRVRDDDVMVRSCSDRAGIMLGMSSNRLLFLRRKQFKDF